VKHPDFALFLLRFGREESQVVEAFHGPDWYVNERYAGPTTFDYPFDPILNGQAVHANLSCGDCYGIFTP